MKKLIINRSKINAGNFFITILNLGCSKYITPILKVNYISVANDHASNATDVTVAIVKAGFTSAGIGSGEDNAATIYLASTVTLPADDVLVVLDKPIYLMEGDVLEGGANPATADIFISYEVIDDA